MIKTPDITRPPKIIVERLSTIGAATASGELKKLGIQNPFIQGPVSKTPGKSIVGPALTLKFMPVREDQYQIDEYQEPETQLHRHVLYHTKPGDIVVVDALGDMTSGVFGEMMLTYFQGRGGIGVVIDGCIRDWPNAQKLDLGFWIKGVTPNFHTQTGKFPFAVNTPISCANTLIMPGDLIVADDDGAVVVPAQLASKLADVANEHNEWEEFSRLKLEQGGDLRKYYPMNAEAQIEY